MTYKSWINSLSMDISKIRSIERHTRDIYDRAKLERIIDGVKELK